MKAFLAAKAISDSQTDINVSYAFRFPTCKEAEILTAADYLHDLDQLRAKSGDVDKMSLQDGNTSCLHRRSALSNFLFVVKCVFGG